MINPAKQLIILCGLVLTLSASAVFAQDAVREIQINKRPLQDFAAMVKEKTAEEKVDLAAPFSVELDGTLQSNGRLDKKTRIGNFKGDEQILEIAKSGIEAVNYSEIFNYLSSFGATKISLIVSQDKNQFSVLISSPLSDEITAKTAASVLNFSIELGKRRIIENKDEVSAADTLLLLNSAKITTSGKTILISVEIPAGEFQKLIQKELNKVK